MSEGESRDCLIVLSLSLRSHDAGVSLQRLSQRQEGVSWPTEEYSTAVECIPNDKRLSAQQGLCSVSLPLTSAWPLRRPRSEITDADSVLPSPSEVVYALYVKEINQQANTA